MKKLPEPKGIIKFAQRRLSGEAAAIIPGLRIELLQNRQAIVEGCKGVLEYSEECIRLGSDRLIVRFKGRGLLLKTFNSSSAIVEGQIDSVDFM